MRWLVGKFAFLLRLAVATWIVGLFLRMAGFNWAGVFGFAMYPLMVLVLQAPPVDWKVLAICLGVAGFIFLAVMSLVEQQKPVVARVTRPLRHLWRSLKSGVGGSSAFGGLLDEWDGMQWKPGRIMVGTSLYEPGQRLGKADDRHVITIATSRSGKGRSAVIPNLLTWPGPRSSSIPRAKTRRSRQGRGVNSGKRCILSIRSSCWNGSASIPGNSGRNASTPSLKSASTISTLSSKSATSPRRSSCRRNRCFAPFIYRYHAPKDLHFQDYFRFTRDGIAYMFRDFSDVTIYPVRGRTSSALNFGVTMWKPQIERRWPWINKFADKITRQLHDGLQCSGNLVWAVK